MTQAPTPTADTVRRLVRSLLGESAASDVRPAATGAEPATWWVGTRHVLRLATDRGTALRQRRELRLRELVRPYVSVTVPTSVAHGEWAPGLTYTLDGKVPGGSAEEHHVSALGEADLAALLSGLREVPVRQAETLGVPRAAPRPLETLRQSAESAGRRLAEADEFDPARPERLTREASAQLGVQPGSPAVLVHHALADEHLVVGADGRVRGVLGWSDAVLGDPAEDIAALALRVGSPAAVRAATLAGYGARPCLRGLWLARCDTLVHLADTLAGRPSAPATVSLPLLRTRLRRAWEPILLERVTELREDGTGGDGPA
ncbi:aminoglycoside phosphotransferase family protein [Streptomyces sp. MA25(2023)]|uniref:aminoglycoside phosphotransferase family protein n=1 Tax=Streptomyces TaxID=1883 RepID=UPI0025B0A674|nr:aminoglycoside phosphotransferase family protein [Streptomyces sp. MA25(2023)]MDN3256429.1 aminoglycoside phosphotransferase family protein [Streptomyces sp. MA25(2023)]